MPISADATPVTRQLLAGREYEVEATGGTLEIETQKNGAPHSEGVVGDGERFRLLIGQDYRWIDVTFTPSGAGVDWSYSRVK